MKSTSLTARNDGYAGVLREAVETLRSRDRVQVLTATGLQEVLSDPALYRQYKALLCEKCEADTAEQLDQLFDNFQTVAFQEASLSSIEPVSALTMPILRKAWPKIGMKEALPTEPVKTPKFTVSYLMPYIIDPVTGVKLQLPQALKGAGSVNTSRTPVVSTPWVLPLNAANVMPAGCPVSAGYTLDPIFSAIAVDVVCTDAAGANPVTLVNVLTYDGASETRLGNIRFTITVANPTDGHETSDTVFGFVDYAGGTVTMTDMSGAASATKCQITKVYFAGYIETTSNKSSTSVGFDITTKEVHIGTGEHFDAQLPLEWLQDNLALYNIDGTLKVVDILTDVMAQKVDLQAISFVEGVYAKNQALNNTNFVRTFDVFPTGNYMGSPTDWLNELKRITDNLVQTMRNYSNFGGGTFVIVGNPLDVALYVGINWIFTAQGDDQRDGVQVNYSIGAMSGAQRYMMFSSQNFSTGTMYIFFIPGAEDQKVLTYYPYTFNVERSSSGFVSPNYPNTPSVLLVKRQAFVDFIPLVGMINILNNNGTLPN
jgi:hypothetical protein